MSKILLIGASGTIGQAVLTNLGARHDVITVGRSSGTHRADFSQPGAVAQLFEAVGKVDAIVSTAGNLHFGPLTEMTAEQFNLGLQDKLLGQVQLALLPPGLAMAQVKAGKLRAIGLTSSGRSTLAPEVPSLAELGVKNYQLEIWNAVAAPARMPAAHVQRLATLISEIVRGPEMRQRLFQQGWQVVGSAPEGLALRIAADTQALGAIIRQQKITLN